MKQRRSTPQDDRPEINDESRVESRVSPEAIACRAHERYVQRGGVHGLDLEDWLAAEHELLEELGIKH